MGNKIPTDQQTMFELMLCHDQDYSDLVKFAVLESFFIDDSSKA